MPNSRRYLRHGAMLLLTVLVGVALTGCEDPSNVGLGLIGESGGEPVRMKLPATQLPYNYTPPPTSNVRTSLGYSTGASRVLAGTVDDPLFGTISAKGYIDFSISSSAPADYRSGTITSVQLELVPNYIYGDSVATASVIVSEMQEPWPTTSMTSDTTLSPGVEVTRADFSFANDTSLVVDLPEAWYGQRSAVLLSSDFLDDFHGFELTTAGTSGVFGFDANSGTLRIVTTTGSAEMLVSKIFTHIERPTEPNLPPNRATVHDGIGQNLALSFDFAADSVAGSAVSRAVIQLAVDSLAMADVPENFFRPEPTQFDFLGVKQDGTTTLVRSAILGSNNSIRFVSNAAGAGQDTIIRIIQQAAAGNSEYKQFRVRISETQAAINAILLYAPGAEENAPAAVVTLTPNSF